jgi:hypothetical protein
VYFELRTPIRTPLENYALGLRLYQHIASN